MAPEFFSQEVLVDVSVNFIPIAILAAFLALLIVVAPWGGLLTLETAIQVALILIPLAGVAALTYVAAGLIEDGDNENR